MLTCRIVPFPFGYILIHIRRVSGTRPIRCADSAVKTISFLPSFASFSTDTSSDGPDPITAIGISARRPSQSLLALFAM
jgi:hypothetical protein